MNESISSRNIPRVVISALKGGAGKTILSLGITGALKKAGKKVVPFKKGPDYIDAGWLSLAAESQCHNLDTFLLEKETVLNSFIFHGSQCDISLIEGNRGLYDGIDLEGNTSTAEIAKLLKAPVILCLDCTKSTRTVAATVLGCIKFDPDVNIEGVILNRVAGPRHRNIVTKTIEHVCGIPVIGAVPKLKNQDFPERHMGLIPSVEHEWAITAIEKASEIIKENVNLQEIINIANNSPEIPGVDNKSLTLYPEPLIKSKKKPVIGVIRDSAFQFYYPENIESLKKAGAEIKVLSPLKQKNIPDVDGIYIGGGFPETHAKELSENISFKKDLKNLIEKNLPVYAECGGLIFLGREIIINDTSFPMTNIFPISYSISKKPQGHGYIIIKADKENPFFKKGTIIKGHEFRYSKITDWDKENSETVFFMERGTGMEDKRDGVVYKNVLATYAHIHALGIPPWAEALVQKADLFKRNK